MEKSGLFELDRQGSRAQTFEITDKGRDALTQMDQLFELVGIDSGHDREE